MQKFQPLGIHIRYIREIIYLMLRNVSELLLYIVSFLRFNRWKKMEHHDVVIECDRFTLDKCREEILSVVNPRCTPPLGQHYHLHV